MMIEVLLLRLFRGLYEVQRRSLTLEEKRLRYRMTPHRTELTLENFYQQQTIVDYRERRVKDNTFFSLRKEPMDY